MVENLRLTETVAAALGDLGVDLDRMRRAEPDAALGNGGLGRLAACLMESMASLGIPAFGYGIRYDHGLFHQVFRDGWQQEIAEDWLSFGNPWEFARPEAVYDVQFGGRVEMREAAPGRVRPVWRPDETIEAVAYDTPIVGWRGRHVNPLRLWSARAVDPLRLELFNEGDHIGALSDQARAAAISKILYPSDTSAGSRIAPAAGIFLRLGVAAGHPAPAPANLQRSAVVAGARGDPAERHASEHRDRRNDAAAARCLRAAVGRGMARHRKHVWLHQPHAVARSAGALAGRTDRARIAASSRDHLSHQRAASRSGARTHIRRIDEAALSIIDEADGRHVRMGHLAFIGSHRVNGVSALHTTLLRETVFADLHRLYPERIINKTNGITFRRWLHQANPRADPAVARDLR